MIGRRRLLVLLVLLVAGCSSSSSDRPQAPGSSTVAAGSPSVAAGTPNGEPAIPGVVLLTTDPSHAHTTERQTYPQMPPVGGPHWPPSAFGVLGWLRCGVYDVPVPAEFAVHSEEHGAVWLTYRPGTAAADVRALAELAGLNTGYVLVSPFSGQPAAFMASTWGAQLSTARPTDPRLAAFVRTYAGGDQGQEGGSDCAHGTLPAQAAAALKAANP